MDDLITFLRARLDEDEQTARRVESSWRQIGETGVIIASDGDRAEECANGNWTGVAEHIVRHDPARALRDVEAKRQLLDRYADVASNDIDEPYEYAYGWANGLGAAVRLLALPYSDHPDYRDNWRP